MSVVILKKQKPFKRGHGFLLPVFSLPTPYGIGTLGSSAKEFIDFVSSSGGYMWQVLPLGPTGFGNSPYQCFSAFGGNHLFIDPQWIYEKGWITKEQFDLFLAPVSGEIDYAYLYKTRKPLLYKAYQGFLKYAEQSQKKEFENFKDISKYWLQDYAMFMALKEENNFVGRSEFNNNKLKEETNLTNLQNKLAEKIEFQKFLEYVFYTQWQEIKSYANKRNIMLVGDIPLYVADDSADVWANPKLFMLDKEGNSTDVAGVPPDIFSKDGQLWGNPVYRWENHRQSGYNWWSERIKWQSKLFDVIRLDHFIGICRYYSIKANEQTAKNGAWLKGPERELISTFLKAADGTRFIAEDLGVLTDEVKKLISASAFPGMKILQFAFSDPKNENLFHKIPQNSVVYTGTHDNDTLIGFLTKCGRGELDFAKKYLGVKKTDALGEQIIRECFKSSANTVIIPLYDYLGLGSEARINTPSTLGNNWQWQLTDHSYFKLAMDIKNLAEIYERTN